MYQVGWTYVPVPVVFVPQPLISEDILRLGGAVQEGNLQAVEEIIRSIHLRQLQAGEKELVVDAFILSLHSTIDDPQCRECAQIRRVLKQLSVDRAELGGTTYFISFVLCCLAGNPTSSPEVFREAISELAPQTISLEWFHSILSNLQASGNPQREEMERDLELARNPPVQSESPPPIAARSSPVSVSQPPVQAESPPPISARPPSAEPERASPVVATLSGVDVDVLRVLEFTREGTLEGVRGLIQTMNRSRQGPFAFIDLVSEALVIALESRDGRLGLQMRDELVKLEVTRFVLAGRFLRRLSVKPGCSPELFRKGLQGFISCMFSFEDFQTVCEGVRASGALNRDLLYRELANFLASPFERRPNSKHFPLLHGFRLQEKPKRGDGAAGEEWRRRKEQLSPDGRALLRAIEGREVAASVERLLERVQETKILFRDFVFVYREIPDSKSGNPLRELLTEYLLGGICILEPL